MKDSNIRKGSLVRLALKNSATINTGNMPPICFLRKNLPSGTYSSEDFFGTGYVDSDIGDNDEYIELNSNLVGNRESSLVPRISIRYEFEAIESYRIGN